MNSANPIFKSVFGSHWETCLMNLLPASVNIVKEAMSDDEFTLDMVMSHPILGKYIYAGRFKIVDNKKKAVRVRY